jgi:four helix bundle protein
MAEAEIIGKQLLRSGTSVAANYRAVCRARSKREFISRVGVVVEEADETVFWLEMLHDNNILPQARLQPLLNEARELTAIFTASERTAKRRRGSITQLPDCTITQSHNG